MVALAKRASDATVGWSELDKSAPLFRNPSREISRSHPTIPHTDNLPATMVFPDPYPSPPEPDAFSPMPYAATEEDSTAQWAQVAGYVQPEPIDGIHFDFESLDAIFPWEQGSTLSEPTPDSQICHRVSTGPLW